MFKRPSLATNNFETDSIEKVRLWYFSSGYFSLNSWCKKTGIYGEPTHVLFSEHIDSAGSPPAGGLLVTDPWLSWETDRKLGLQSLLRQYQLLIM